jgi:hypothetical protein
MLKSTSSIYFMATIMWWRLELGIGIGSWVGNRDEWEWDERRKGRGSWHEGSRWSWDDVRWVEVVEYAMMGSHASA